MVEVNKHEQQRKIKQDDINMKRKLRIKQNLVTYRIRFEPNSLTLKRTKLNPKIHFIIIHNRKEREKTLSI